MKAKKTVTALPPTNLWNADQVVVRMHQRGLVDLNHKWLKNLSDRGQIPYVVVGKLRRYREDYIEQLIQVWTEAAA